MKTVLLVRHADIDPPPGPAPDSLPLNPAGMVRATELARVVGGAGVTAVFASPAARTQQTATPVLAATGLPLQVPATAALPSAVLSAAAGDVVLVVGHSNTVPAVVAALGAAFPGPPLSGHDDLLVVSVHGPGQATAVRLKYGAVSP